MLTLLTIGGSILIYLSTFYHLNVESMENERSNLQQIVRGIPLERWREGAVSPGYFMTEGYMTVLDNNGKELYKKEVHYGLSGEKGKMDEFLKGGIFKRFIGPFVSSIAMTVSSDSNESVVFTYYNRELTERLDDLRHILLIVTISIISIGTLGIYLFTHLLFRRVGVIINSMNQITESGNLKEIPLKNKRDELGQIVYSFNKMISGIKEMMTKQEAFVMNVSHELKTPITIIEGYTKLLERWGFEKKEVAEESIQHIIEETDRMKNGLIEPMLQLTSLKNQVIVKEEIQLDLIANDIVDKMKMISQREMIVTGKGTVQSNRELVEQILFILIDNAIKYSDKQIIISISDNYIAVKDDGIGIKEEDVPFIFDRFYRGDKARTDKKGVGLGLAIAKENTDLLGAKLEYERNKEGGSVFYLKFKEL
jgi:signal transduction histidine kinase